MKTLRIAVFALVALVQLAVPGSMIWKRQHTSRDGRVWKFRTAPVDPIDAIRGRYLALRFTAEKFDRAEPMPTGEVAYVALKEDADGFAIVDQVSPDAIPGDNIVQVDRFVSYDNKAHIFFAFDKFWVSEADAGAAERAYAAHSNRQQLDAYVTVRVHAGDAAVEELYLAGQPLHEYLRGHPTP